MKTFVPKIDPNGRKWYVLDLQGVTLGRAAVKVATILRGKDKPIFTPHVDTGDHVIAVNASGLKVTGGFKAKGMKYHHYSGYPGGLKTINYENLMKKNSSEVFSIAVRRMLPKTKLGRQMIKKLHVYSGEAHPHAAQKPQALKLG